jgi:hypothetical protein
MVAVKLVVVLPLLVKVTVALTVVPATPSVGKAIVVLTSDSSTVSVPVTVAEFVPTDVLKEPAGMVFAAVPVPVTTTEAEQEPPGGITLPELTVNCPAPAGAVTVEPFKQVVAGSGGDALTIPSPSGYASTNGAVNVAETNAWVLVNVITNNVVPPALMVDGVNDLETVGRLGVTASGSTAVQVPDPHPAPVLVTPDGTEMIAVLVT